MTEKLSVDQLEQEYNEPAVREAIYRLFNIMVILQESILQKNYRVPLTLYEPLELTAEGQRVLDQLRKRHVPYPEARIICLLEFTNNGLLIDPRTTRVEKLIAEISKQITDRTILYPFTQGRLLYDKYFDLFGEEGRSSLNLAETERLLKDTPQGVYQAFDLITGPYGILRSQSFRSLLPDTDIRLRHCSDLSCAAVHRVVLSSDREAEINKHSDVRRKIRESATNEPACTEFLSKLSADYLPIYKDWAIEPIIFLIGDALTNEEIKTLFDWLLENSQDRLREAISSVNLVGSTGTGIPSLSRAQMLQLILVCTDANITKGLDALVRSGKINVPFGEVRRCVITRSHFGRHAMFAELGPFGVRVQTAHASVAPLRARRLVESMYRMDDAGDRQELEWQLREETSDSVEAKLENYLQTKPLRKSLGSLILARKSNVVVAAEVLGLDDNGYGSDEDLLSAALWKLGFTIDDRDEPHARFWQVHQRMLQQARASVTGSASDRDEIRSLAAQYFVELEGLLDDSLAYTTWALTNDHYASPKPFVYRPAVDRTKSMELLTQRKTDDSSPRLVFGEKSNLFPLAHGYARLNVRLEEFEAESAQYERASSDMPEWVSVQVIEKFPFMHLVPFLDLLPDCKTAIKRALDSVTSQLNGADISDTRAEWLHNRRSATDLERLRESLDSIGSAVRTIEEHGFSRQLYVRVKDDRDGDGRRTVVLASASGREISFFRPSSFAWLRLPSPASAQYVMNSARFAEPSEALRFTAEIESAYSQMWDNFPRRPLLERGRSVVGGSALRAIEV